LRVQMPNKWRNDCSVSGCNLSASTGRMCSMHRKEAKARHDLNRPNAHKRGYDSQWKRTRDAFIRNSPVCEFCGGPAEVIDHIVPIRCGGSSDEDNTQSLCRKCHALKTASDMKFYGAYKQVVDERS
jgi:5-methylcytosine-specific restriction enzyme A